MQCLNIIEFTFPGLLFCRHSRKLQYQFYNTNHPPLCVYFAQGLPRNDASVSSAGIYAGVLFTFGLIKAWPAPACNNPLFAEIVPENQRTLVYAFDRCFETALAACTAPLVGLFAEKVFGFDGAATPSGDKTIDLANAKALGDALLYFMVVPWIIDFVLYSGLHWTYGPDVRKAAEATTLVTVFEAEVGLEREDAADAQEMDTLVSTAHHRHT